MQSLVFEQHVDEQLARFLEVEDARKQQFLLLTEMRDGLFGEKAQERGCDRRRFRSIGGPPKATRLDQCAVVIVRERNERWVTLHLIGFLLARSLLPAS